MMSDAAAHLRRNREGVLIADGLALRVPFVIDGATGRIVFPADGTTLGAEELVLFVPREQPDDDHELQLLLGARAADRAEGPACDRWRAYHGDPRLTGFASCAIEGAKFNGQIVEDVLTAPNPLTTVEGRLCRRLNADRALLGAACLRIAGVDVQDPLAVGIDPFGVDVRARFGIVRLEFSAPSLDAGSAERAIDALLGDER